MTLRVLVVDDHPAILRHVSSWVGATRVAEVVATSSVPGDVTALWDEVQPDVTLCDVHMPDIDGLELCQQLRALHPDARVLLFSARDDRTTRDRAERLLRDLGLGDRLTHRPAALSGGVPPGADRRPEGLRRCAPDR